MSQPDYNRHMKYKQGLARKFQVLRIDGRDMPGQKHHGCQYFILDLDHDPFAAAALTAYVKACKLDYPELAADLRKLLEGS